MWAIMMKSNTQKISAPLLKPNPQNNFSTLEATEETF